MKHLISLLLVSLALLACKKEGTTPIQVAVPEPETYSTATYLITVTGKWNAADFTVPPGVHFTRIAGAVHHKSQGFWRAGELATKSLEAIAENGNSVPMWAEVDSLIGKGKALSKIAASTPPPTGQSIFTIQTDTNFPLISFASMLAPSPDWFFGVSSLSLYANKTWIKDTVLQLYSFDAGTEEGDVFGYYNPETSPQVPIHLLTTSNASVLLKGSVLPIAEMHIQKQ